MPGYPDWQRLVTIAGTSLFDNAALAPGASYTSDKMFMGPWQSMFLQVAGNTDTHWHMQVRWYVNETDTDPIAQTHILLGESETITGQLMTVTEWMDFTIDFLSGTNTDTVALQMLPLRSTIQANGHFPGAALLIDDNNTIAAGADVTINFTTVAPGAGVFAWDLSNAKMRIFVQHLTTSDSFQTIKVVRGVETGQSGSAPIALAPRATRIHVFNDDTVSHTWYASLLLN